MPIMKLPIIAPVAALLALQPALGGTLKLTGNRSVTVEITLKEATLASGAAGEMAISFAPAAGIHVNSTPAPEFTLDSSSLASLSGRLTFPKGTQYLKPASAVKQRFQLSRGAKPGPVTLKGTLTYYFCSDKEGWCSKYKQPVEIALTVRR